MKSLFTLLATTAVAAATTWSSRVTTLQDSVATSPAQEVAPTQGEPLGVTQDPEAVLVRKPLTELHTVPAVVLLGQTIGTGQAPQITSGVASSPNTREVQATDRDDELAQLRKRLAELEEELARREAQANDRPREGRAPEVSVRGRQIEVFPSSRGGSMRAQGDVEIQTREMVRGARELAEFERNRAEEARALAAHEQHRAMEARARAEEMREQSAAIAREAERARDEALALRARMLEETKAQVDALRAEAELAVREANARRLGLGRPAELKRYFEAHVAPAPAPAPVPLAALALPTPPAQWPAEAAMPARAEPPATSIHIHVEKGDVHIHHGAGAAEVHVKRSYGVPTAPNSKPDTDKGQKPGPSTPKSKKDKDRVSSVESQGLDLLETMDLEVPMAVALSAITALEDLDFDGVELGRIFTESDLVESLTLPQSVATAAESVEKALAARFGAPTGTQATVVEEPAFDELLRLVREMHADLTALREELSALRGEVEVAPLRGAR